jgi:hypothetical protein
MGSPDGKGGKSRKPRETDHNTKGFQVLGRLKIKVLEVEQAISFSFT